MTRSFAPEPVSAGAPAAHGIVAVVFALLTVVVAWQFFGLDERNAGGDASSFDRLGSATAAPALAPVSVTQAGTVAEAVSTPTATAAPATATPVPTALPTAPPVVADANRTPTKQDKLRLYIAGDSDAGNMGPPLQQALEKTGLVDSELFYKVSSGLTRPDFFDWPRQLENDIGKLSPDVVVVTFGGNDAQDILIAGQYYPVASAEWQTEYARRVGAVMEYLSSAGRKLIWVGIPNAEEEKFRQRLQILEQVTRTEAAKRPLVTYFATWDKFIGASGGYASHHRDPRDGIGKQVRAGDGFHLNVAGSEILAWYVTDLVRQEMLVRGAQL